MVTWIGKKSNIRQSEHEKYFVSDCKTNFQKTGWSSALLFQIQHMTFICSKMIFIFSKWFTYIRQMIFIFTDLKFIFSNMRFGYIQQFQICFSRHQNKVWNIFRVKNEDTRMNPMTSSWCLYYQLWTYFTPCSSASVPNLEHVFICWAWWVSFRSEKDFISSFSKLNT